MELPESKFTLTPTALMAAPVVSLTTKHLFPLLPHSPMQALTPQEDISLTFCNRPPLPFRFPSPGSPGAEHDQTIIRMVDDEQSWGDIETLAGEEAFDRYYSFLDPGLEDFWTREKIEQLNDAVIDHVGRFLKPRAAIILKGNHQQWPSKNSITTSGGCSDTNNNNKVEDVKKVATIYPVVVISAWMDMSRWEKVATSVRSSTLVCQHIWSTFGDGRPFTEEEQPYLDEIKAIAIENTARISAIKEAATRMEAAKTKAAQEEADRLEAERLEAEKIEAAKVETKRVEANKIRVMKRKAKTDAFEEEEEEREAMTRKSATRKRESSETRVAKELAVRQQKIAMQQENIAREKAAMEGRAKHEIAKAEATRIQVAKEVNEDAPGTSKAKRETAMAAAKAWETAVRGVAARKAELQSMAIKRRRITSSAQAGLDRDQDLSLSPGPTMGSKRKIGNMDVFLPPTTFVSSSSTVTVDQESRPAQKDIFSPSTLRASVSTTSCSSLISPAPSPQDESLAFQLSTQSTINTALPAVFISVNNNAFTPESPAPPTLPPMSLSKGAESEERIKKLMAMKQVLMCSVQSIELQRQDQQTETDLLLRQRDAAIKAAKARQPDGSNISGYHENNKADSPQVSPEDPTPASLKASQESTPVSTGRPSPTTPNKPLVSLSLQPAAAVPNAASHVIDLTDDADHGRAVAASTTQLQSPPQQLPIQQQHRQLLSAQQILQAQQNYQHQQHLLQQHLQQGPQRLSSQQQQQQQQQQLPPPPLLQHPQPTKSFQHSQLPIGLPAPPVEFSPQFPQQIQQVQEYIQQLIRKSPELQKLHQQHVVEKEQLLQRQRQDRQRLAQEQQLLAAQLQNSLYVEEHMRLQAVNQWRQREKDWKSRVQEIQRQEKILGPKLAEHRQQTQKLQLTIINEHQQWQHKPAFTTEQVKQLHQTQRINLATSQQQRYLALQSLSVDQQADAMANLNRMCQREAQALMAQQKDMEGKVVQLQQRREASKKTIPWLQIQLQNSQENEKALMKQVDDLHAQKQEQERLRLVLLQEHQALQHLQMMSAPSSSSSPQTPVVGQGPSPLNLAMSQMDRQLREKHAMDERVRQQLTQQRDVQRKTQLQQQSDLQQAQRKALIDQARALAEVHIQGLKVAISQGQPWSVAQIQGQQKELALAQQQQVQTTAVQDQQAKMNDQPTLTVPTADVPLNQMSTAKPISLPPKPAPVLHDPARPQPVSQLQATSFAQPQQLTTTPRPSQPVTSGSTPTSVVPALEPGQNQQPSLESTAIGSSKPAAIFPFPNPLYDITEWTAEDKNRLWTTWLEVGDDWEQISAKGLQGKFSVEACRAVIQGTAS
ncbi:hypothetical protein BGZ97_012802 [Linnemannia gamsii]|uniref:Uncharacterized protein n=1 Tax=Linnemannia gamsii TaxID=64522 RepID=A0A9P6R0A2_9FUNG|nr:hypothetical protein BGZ97_012802 [Linnemannia gamsii]